jgi:hypothetical protein
VWRWSVGHDAPYPLRRGKSRPPVRVPGGRSAYAIRAECRANFLQAGHGHQRPHWLAGWGGRSGLVAAVSGPLGGCAHYVGLNVSAKETSVCIIDKAGKVIHEVKVATKPAAILAFLTEEALAIERIGLEAGPLSQWLYSALAEAGLPVICVETRHRRRRMKGTRSRTLRCGTIS